jgi:hypothetical protein
MAKGVRHRRRPGRRRQGQEPPGRDPQVQSEARPVATRQSAAADLCHGRRRRAAALHLAPRRKAAVALRLQRRSLDRNRVPGGLPPDDGRQDGPEGFDIVRACRGPLRRECVATRSTSTSAATGTPGPCRASHSSRATRVCATTPSRRSCTSIPDIGDFRAPLFTATGFGTVERKAGSVKVTARAGKIAVD